MFLLVEGDLYCLIFDLQGHVYIYIYIFITKVQIVKDY